MTCDGTLRSRMSRTCSKIGCRIARTVMGPERNDAASPMNVGRLAAVQLAWRARADTTSRAVTPCSTSEIASASSAVCRTRCRVYMVSGMRSGTIYCSPTTSPANTSSGR